MVSGKRRMMSGCATLTRMTFQAPLFEKKEAGEILNIPLNPPHLQRGEVIFG